MSSGELIPTDPQASGSMVEVASGRAAQEVQALVVMAKRYPRDETAAIQRIEQACKRKGLAEAAMYQYSRGGTNIEGPSIRLAEVLAQCWGNVDHGLTELEQRDGESDVQSFCWDLETNTRSTKTFTVKHERHKRGGAITHLSDPRDIYEHTANYGARRLRACILAIIPGDIQDLAVAACNKTLEGDSTELLIDRIRKMVGLFVDEGVPQEAIERRVQHKVDACNLREIIALGKIYRSLKDGMSEREDWFELHAGTEDLDERAAKLEDKPPRKTRNKPAESQEEQPAFAQAAEDASDLVSSEDSSETDAQQARVDDYTTKAVDATSLQALKALWKSLEADKVLRPNAISRVKMAIEAREAQLGKK